MLIKKYDHNNDDEINFNEFQRLFLDINNQFNEFLDVDQDFSGTIDSRELANALRRKGYTFSPEFFNFFMHELTRRTAKQAITFDIYVRVISRFDQLKVHFLNMPQNRANPAAAQYQLEPFIRQAYFQ